MTREEQTRKAADDYCGDDAREQSPCFYAHIHNAFLEGAEWADSHPQWIPVDEELPKHKEEENGLITYEEVLVSLNDGYVTTDCYDDSRKKWLGYNGDVEYWMPTPQPPRKEE